MLAIHHKHDPLSPIASSTSYGQAVHTVVVPYSSMVTAYKAGSTVLVSLTGSVSLAQLQHHCSLLQCYAYVWLVAAIDWSHCVIIIMYIHVTQPKNASTLTC